MNIYVNTAKSQPVTSSRIPNWRKHDFKCALKKSGIKAVPHNPGNEAYEGVVVQPQDAHKASMILRSLI